MAKLGFLRKLRGQVRGEPEVSATTPGNSVSKSVARKRKIAFAAALVVVLVSAVAVPSAIAANRKPTMLVAMGDSWTSGTGNPLSNEGSELCRRSYSSYAAEVARRVGATYRNLACSGASTPNLYSDFKGEAAQIEVLRDLAKTNNVRYVTVTIGGNDARAYQAFLDSLRFKDTADFGSSLEGLPVKVSDSLRAIHRAAPRAEILISGYPDLLPREGHELAGCVGDFLARMIDTSKWTSIMDDLNQAVESGAELADVRRVTYVEPASFAGHSVCSKEPWAHGIANPFTNPEGSLHPNIEGHRAIADAVLAAM